MFKDFIAMSKCAGKGKLIEKRLSEVVGDKYNSLNGPTNASVPDIIHPTGFIFHESRVGSTLVANLLASDPKSMVFSESAPPAAALLHCKNCALQKNIENFREIVSMMCRSTYHKRCFFKFQSITTTTMHIALQAFPDVPWVFLYRQPVETMMSHVGPGKGVGAPCLRSKRRPPVEVLIRHLIIRP